MAKLWWDPRKKADVKTEDKTKRKCNHIAEVEHDEYLREQQCPSKQTRRMVVLRNSHTSHSVKLKNMLTLSNSFNIIRALCLTSHTFHSSLHMNDWPSQSMCHAYTNSNPRMFNSYGDAHEAYTANTYMNIVYLGVIIFSFVHIPILFSFYFSVTSQCG